ncbi:MAG: DEAD/DEAH box helicase family protein [Cyanothece sp. SIO1E1]|nr:DEAD/DEAH box helicase family protein [Cyanothece sp. SIO1E1]
MSNPHLATYFADYFCSGGRFSTIVEARQQAGQILGQPILPGTAEAKRVDESIEVGVVRAARKIVEAAQTTHQAYDQLVNLLERQPNLNVRSSTSVLQQAYSTPVPIAYLVSVMARINAETTVYEPTAGNGALLIAANPAQVIANEMNGDRLSQLSTQGYRQLTQNDATTYRPQVQVDRVICNPPFGTVRDPNHRPQRFRLADTWTTQVDQVIALNALAVMKDDGRAALILGGKKGREADVRSDRYNIRESRAFFYRLYHQYNVTQHFSIWGDLYRKQGAGFPIDVIVIEGRGKSQRPLPAAEVPAIYKSFVELKELLPDESSRQLPQLSPNLGSRLPRTLIRRESSHDSGGPYRASLQSTDARPGGLDYSMLDDRSWQHSGRDSTTSGDNTKRTTSLTGYSSDQLKRGPSERSQRLATGLGRGVYQLQRTLQRSAISAGSNLPSHTIGRSSSRVSTTDRNSSAHLFGGMAHQPDSLTFSLATEANNMDIIAASEMEPPQDLGAQPRQTPYLPKSQGESTQTLIPYNMASAAQTALEQFELRHGNIDEYLTSHLGYASIRELYQHFSAEQVDAAALAISNLEQGNGFITGDQTGVGKGRICASIMRYAAQQGKVAVFVTQKNTLYADMMRDVSDIGMHNFHPFATDANAKIPLANGQELRTTNSAQQEKLMREMIASHNIGSYSAVFTTYSQLQTVAKKEPLRRQFLRGIAPNAIFILDEAHEAGGTKGGWKLQNEPPDRAEFVRELVDLSAGVVYSSATYAKRPDVMDLYARRTDLRHAVSNMATLENILTQGGVPLQQMVASKFVAAGQMLRRERSYEGISFQAQVVSVDREVADQFAAAMRAIKDFDWAKQKALKELDKQLKAEAKDIGEDGAIGEIGAKSTNFTSLMHNCIEQGLLAQKADATVQAASQSLQHGQKPVIALANTMGSFIEGYAETQDLRHGDPIDVSFSDLLARYLERSRDVVIRDYRGQTTRHRLTDEELGAHGMAAYEEALVCIQEADLNRIPISPIDYITQQLERQGYSVAEVTGRKAGLDYAPDGSTTYRIRPERERTPKARIDAVAQFNSGDMDVIILNCAGSTGISLHASEKFADPRPRHMIVAQAERDINVFMQMLGRVHRTGQVALPSYTLLMSDLPAEKRPGAILCRKMASLNANTTAARETDLSLTNVVDFMNAYGEQVVQELLQEDLELDAKLDFPLAQSAGDSAEIGLIKRVTGRIPLLSIAEQETVYDLIESEYRDLVEQQRAMGENILEADQLDLDARTLARMEVIPDDSQIQSEFTGAVYLELVDAKSSAKPLTQLQVVNSVRSELGLSPVKELVDHDREEGRAIAHQKAVQIIAQLDTTTEQYRAAVVARKQDAGAIAKFNDKLNRQRQHVQEIVAGYLPGTPIRVVTPISQHILYGVVAGIDQKTRPGSPAAANSWKIRLLVADSARQLTLPLSKFNTGREGSATVDIQEQDWFGHDVYTLFDKYQQAGRINRQIFTGNIIKAFEKYPKGKLVNYTDHQGQVHQGLIMPKDFDIREELAQEPVAFSRPEQIKAFITDLTEYRGAVKTLDELLILKAQPNGQGFILQAPRAKESGGKYYLDESLIEAAGSDFHSVSDRMEVVIPPERLEQTLNVLMHQRGYTLAAFDFKEIAREYLGIKLPELEVVEPKERELHKELEPPKPPAIPSPLAHLPHSQSAETLLQKPAEESTALGQQPLQIAPPQQQSGAAEKNVARFLASAGLAEILMAQDEFHLKIEHEPYIPLVIERHGHTLYLTHYLEQNGDLFIDSEMVFTLDPDNGRLCLEATAVNSIGGEYRGFDRGFAQIFSRNILQQGFAQAAMASAKTSKVESERVEAPNLFDIDSFTTPATDARIDSTGYDPTWETPRESNQPAVAASALLNSDPNPSQPLQPQLEPTASANQRPDIMALADRVREADLEVIAVHLGLQQDPHDKHKWQDSGHIISINHGKFMDWLADKGGGGAIDLVMHVQTVDFKTAVQWLSGQDLTAQPSYPQWRSQATDQEPRPFEMPSSSERRWPAVQNYLVERRKLPAALVNRLHERGFIYADDLQNAVFLRYAHEGSTWNRQEPNGASLRGTWGEGNTFHGLAPGSSREEGWFWIGAGQGEIKRVMLTESPIDGLSLAVLDQGKPTTSGVTIYLSTDGAGTIPIMPLQQVQQQGGQVAVAFDADAAGEEMAWRVAQQLPGVRRMVPAYGKDWNERLVHDGHPEQASQPTRDKQTLRALWQWHQVAKEINKSAPYLTRITEVAREFVKGQPLSNRAQAAMARDLQAFQKQQQFQISRRRMQLQEQQTHPNSMEVSR